MTNATITRRRFLQTSAGASAGLVLGFYLPGAGRLAQLAEAAETSPVVNSWLRIAPDNTVTILVSSSEMGQGVFTSLPMLIAEELEVDWQSIRAEMAPANPVFKNIIFNMQATGGSTTIRAHYDLLRKVGAQAREMLKQAAAQRWNVDAGQIRAEAGFMHHGEQQLSYGELAADAAQLSPPETVTLKDQADWRILGQSIKRLDTPLKVNGSAQFGVDVQMEGLLVGAVANCPVFGGKLKSLSGEDQALAVNGVKQVLKLENAVIVLGEGYWPATKGLRALSIEWDDAGNGGVDSAQILAGFRQSLEQESGASARNDGDADSALQAAAKTLSAEYEAPYLAHSTMEPMNATAHVMADKAVLWLPTQATGVVPGVVGGVLGIDPANIDVHCTFLGGGFGRRFELDLPIQAALASKMAGAPVKLIWSREEDTQHDFYRPASVTRFECGLDDSGQPLALKSRIACESIFTRVFPQYVHDGIDHTSVEGIADSPYQFANFKTDYVMQDTHVPVGFWRSVGNSQNGFFMESFIDEIAHAGNIDPVELRRQLLAGKERHLAVLNAAVEKAGKPAAGHHQGVAIHESFDGVVAEVVELSVTDNKVKLHKVTTVVDAGTVINPDTIEAQMQSAIVYGLTAAFFGAITIKDGRVEQANFDTYDMLRLRHMPVVETQVLALGEKLAGIGEPGLPPIAPAVANALFKATGQRIRSLPLSRHGISLA